MESGATDDVKAIIGTHNNPNYAPGQIAIGPQPMMAGCVKFKVTLHAQGTHAGYPQKAPAPSSARLDDPRPADHREPQHLAVPRRGAVHHRSAWWARVEVVPAEAGFQGTVRFFDQDDERLVHRRFVAEVEHTAEAYGIAADVDWDCIQVPLVGDEELSEAVAADVPSYGRSSRYIQHGGGGFRGSSRDAGPAAGVRGSSARTGNRGAPTGTVRTSSAWTARSGRPLTSTSRLAAGARRASLTGGGTDHPA